MNHDPRQRWSHHFISRALCTRNQGLGAREPEGPNHQRLLVQLTSNIQQDIQLGISKGQFEFLDRLD